MTQDGGSIQRGEGFEDNRSQPAPEGEQELLSSIEFARRLRREQTPQEQKLLARLRNRRLDGHKFRRQHPVEPYTVDFFCAEAGLVVELDGGGHLKQQEYDRARTRYLERRGYRVIRFSNRQVDEELQAVLESILAAITDCENAQ